MKIRTSKLDIQKIFIDISCAIQKRSTIRNGTAHLPGTVCSGAYLNLHPAARDTTSGMKGNMQHKYTCTNVK